MMPARAAQHSQHCCDMYLLVAIHVFDTPLQHAAGVLALHAGCSPCIPHAYMPSTNTPALGYLPNSTAQQQPF
jgi:hypothetical protein